MVRIWPAALAVLLLPTCAGAVVTCGQLHDLVRIGQVGAALAVGRHLWRADADAGHAPITSRLHAVMAQDNCVGRG